MARISNSILAEWVNKGNLYEIKKYLKEDKNYISFEAYNYLILLSIVFNQKKILNLLLGNQIKQSNDPVVQMIMHPAYYTESKFKEVFNSKHIANLFHSHNSNSHYTLIAIGVLTDNKTFLNALIETKFIQENTFIQAFNFLDRNDFLTNLSKNSHSNCVAISVG